MLSVSQLMWKYCNSTCNATDENLVSEEGDSAVLEGSFDEDGLHRLLVRKFCAASLWPAVVLPKPASVGAPSPVTGDLRTPTGRVAAPKEVAYVRGGLYICLGESKQSKSHGQCFFCTPPPLPFFLFPFFCCTPSVGG